MTLRISGMASGMDIDSIVKQMMTAKRIPLDKLNQQKQILQWQRDNYREINSKLVDFRNNKLLKYNTSAQLNTQKAVVSGNTTALTAEATPSANGIPMTISVTQLAKPATVTTMGMSMIDGGGNRLSANSKLSELQAVNGGFPSAGKYDLAINGGATLQFAEDTSIAEVVRIINTTEGANVTAKFDEITGKLSFTSNEFSAAGQVTLGPANSLLTLFGSNGGTDNTAYQQAEVYINGSTAADKHTFSSNNFTINGVQINLQATTTLPSDPGGGTPVTINTQSDTTKAFETITNFVQNYNDLVSILNTKVSEEKYRDFAPLTDEQKKEMTDNDIEQWDIKAKSGMLKNDEILKATITTMRSTIANQLGDLSSFGIKTGEYYENGKLYIDENKLKAALQSNPQQVTMALQGSSNTDGLFVKLAGNIESSLEKLSAKAGTSRFSADINFAFKSDSVMGRRLSDFNTRISVFQRRLNDMESNYFKQFTTMERTISNYNSQSSSLTSYLS